MVAVGSRTGPEVVRQERGQEEGSATDPVLANFPAEEMSEIF